MRNIETALEEAKVHLVTDQVYFYLSSERWNEFIAVLDAPPKELPELRKLLTQPSVFDR